MKIVFSVRFLNYPCNKKYPENESSPNVLKILDDFFLEYFRISGTEDTAGGAATCPRGWTARPPTLGMPPCLVDPMWVPSTYPCIKTLRLALEKITI